jgi:hypothetical protein
MVSWGLTSLLTLRIGRYLLSLDDPIRHKADWELINAALAGDAQVVDKAAQFYFDKTTELIKGMSYTLPNDTGRRVDIVVCREIQSLFMS